MVGSITQEQHVLVFLMDLLLYSYQNGLKYLENKKQTP
jgi:hypothetical protein